MKTGTLILRYLLASQSTTDSIAEHMQQPEPVVRAFCEDLESESLVERRPIANGALTAWCLTRKGREQVS